MTTEPRRILVVANTLTLAKTLLSWFGEAGYDLSVVTTFSAAKAHLRTTPDLLVTELRLQEYNGLHLALRAQQDGIPTVVIGDPDPVLERDAQQFGATFVARQGLAQENLLDVVKKVCASAELSKSATNNPAWNVFSPDAAPMVVHAWRVQPGEPRRGSGHSSSPRPVLH